MRQDSLCPGRESNLILPNTGVKKLSSILRVTSSPVAEFELAPLLVMLLQNSTLECVQLAAAFRPAVCMLSDYVCLRFYGNIQFLLLLLLWLYSPCGRWPHFQFRNLYTVGRTPWTSDQAVARPLPTQRTTPKQNKRTPTSMPRVGFEPTIPVFERAKTVHSLDRAATVIANI
jgi:hypothetical protein